MAACRFCHKKTKTIIDCDSFGVNEAALPDFTEICFEQIKESGGEDKTEWAFVGERDTALYQQAGEEAREKNVSFPLGEVDRRSTDVPSHEATAYYHCANGEFSLEKMQKLAECGNALIKACGSRRVAIRAIQELNSRAHDYWWGNLDEDGRFFTPLLPKLVPMLKFGIMLEYYGPIPSSEHAPNYPHNRAQSVEILTKFWKLALDRKIFINSSCFNDGGVETTPTTLAPERNPDRTLSADRRLISDLRRVNIHFDSKDCYPVVVPTVNQLADEILRLERLRP